MEEEEVVTDNTENRFTVDLLFVKLLLPSLRAYVTERIETFFEEHPVLKKPGGYRELATDPVKKSVDLVHPIVMYPNDDTLPSFNEFSKLYFEKPFFEKLRTCGDVRVFLVLVTKAGCFSNSQAAVAYKLKNQRDALAHQEIISDRMKGEVFENIESLLQTMPDTDKSLEGMEKVKEHGVRSFLPHLRRNSKSQKKTSNKPAQMTSENFFNSNEREKKSFFISTHLHVTFYVNLFCLVLSLVNMNTCNITSPPEIGDLILGSVDVSENDDVKDDAKNEKGEKELKEAQNMENESTIEKNNKTGGRKKDEINDDHSNESHNESDKENCENKSNKKIKTDGSHSEDGLSQDTKSRKEHNAEVKRKATNDKASNTWITTMKKETKKARLALRSEQQPTTVERKRETQSNGSGKMTAMEVGYHFNCWDPAPDPRFHQDTQLMIGPIPVSLDHEGLYFNLRTIFEARGKVRFMFVHKNFTKDRKTQETVKFGYVVFEEKCDAQRLLKEGVVAFTKDKMAILAKDKTTNIKEKTAIKLREMASVRETPKAHM